LPRAFSTALLLVLLGATTVAFAVTEGLKLEPSPVSRVSVDKVFSPTCDCRTDRAAIRFRLRKTDTLTLSVENAHGQVVRTLVDSVKTSKGIVIAYWDGRDSGAQVVRDGAYRPRVHLKRAHRTIVLPNPIRVDTRPPLVKIVRVRPRVFRPGRRLTVRYHLSEPAQVSIYVDSVRVVRGRTSKTSATLNWYGVSSRVRRGFGPGTYELRLVGRDIAGNISPRSRAVKIRIPIIVLPLLVHPKAGTRFAVRLETDGRLYRWRLAGEGGVSRARRLVVRAPQRPGRYTFVVHQRGERAAVRVIVRAR
jgi:FlgD Ig-like domain